MNGYLFTKTINKIKEDKFLTNSFIVFIGSFLGGFGGYLYNLAMSRMLGPIDYGALASLIALLTIISVPATTIQLVISRSVAQLRAQERLGQVRYFINRANQKFLIIGSVSFLGFILFSPLINNFLHLSSNLPVIILGTILCISFISPVNSGGLHGLQKFLHLSLGGVLGVSLKLLLGIFLVWLGLGINGALGALVVSGIFSILYLYFSLGLPKKHIPIKIDLSKMISYAKSVFLATLCITIFLNIDIILVKHFFDPTTAGHYSVLSLLGKIVFFITGAVPTVMFPMVVDRQTRNQKHFHLLKYAFLLVLFISLLVTNVYFLMPQLIVKILFGSAYLPIAFYLGWFGLMMILFSLINLMVIYNLSIHRTDFIPILIIGAGLETVLICFFHQNIWQIVYSLLIVMSLLLISLIIFFKFHRIKLID